MRLLNAVVGLSTLLLLAGCSAPTGPLKAIDDPDTTACTWVPPDAGSTQVAVSAVENTGEADATVTGVELRDPTTSDLKILGAFLSTREADPYTGAKFDPPGSGSMTVPGGETRLLVYGLALPSGSAHASGVWFTYTIGDRSYRTHTNIAVEVRTTATGCDEYYSSLNTGS